MPSPSNPNGKHGVKLSTFMGDPRLSRKQMEAFSYICQTDPEARILGLNNKHRPIVRARTGIPQRSCRWALLRNGDPAEPGKVMEAWHSPLYNPTLTKE